MQKNSVELVETTGRSLEELAAAGRLASVFCRLARNRFTGVMYVEHEDAGGVFTFRDGMPIYVEELGSDTTFGDQLVEQGLITAEQQAEITAAAIGSEIENEDLAFCEQAIALGVLTRQQVDAELERRLRGRLIQAVGFDTSRIEVDADPDVVAAVPEYPLDLGPLIHTGVRTFFDEEAVHRVLGATDGLYVRLSVSPADAVQVFELDSEDEELISKLDPQATVDRAIQEAAADPLDAWQLICMLVLAELAELSRVPFAPASERSGLRATHAISPRPAPQSQGRMPVVREEVGAASRPRMPSVKAEPARSAQAPRPTSYSSRAIPVVETPLVNPARQPQPRAGSAPVTGERPVHPQPARTHGADASGPVATRAASPATSPVPVTDRSKPRRKLSAALQRLDRELKDFRGVQPQAQPAPAAPAAAPAAPQAVEQLLRMRVHNHVAQKGRVESDASNQAADAYRQGQEALRADQFARAYELLKRACELVPNDQSYQLQAQWAALRAGMLDEDGITKLRAVLREQISDDATKKFAYYALGHVALFEKKDDAAEKFFRKALELDKHNKDAERHLRIIELRRKKAAEGGGNKIFGIEIGKKKG